MTGRAVCSSDARDRGHSCRGTNCGVKFEPLPETGAVLVIWSSRLRITLDSGERMCYAEYTVMQVNKINRGFVHLDGRRFRPGFFVPARGGGLHTRRVCAGPGAPFPRRGEGGGRGAKKPQTGRKNRPPWTSRKGRGQNRPGGRRPRSGPGRIIVAHLYDTVKGRFREKAANNAGI